MTAVTVYDRCFSFGNWNKGSVGSVGGARFVRIAGFGRAVLASLVLVFPLALACLTGTAALAEESRAADSLPAPAEAESADADPENEQSSPENAQPADKSNSIRPALYMPEPEAEVRRIGATAVVTEMSTGLPFPARVDTGATSCSIHCAKMVIDDAAEEPKANVGKPIRFLVENHAGEQQWIEGKIAECVRVRTSEDTDDRYKVRMKLRWQDFEKKVLVTLNDREHMKYPLLLGRNFLSGDFIVDVDYDGDADE
jgi:hypothetical protein